jgi:adenosylcobinamide hydrolase
MRYYSDTSSLFIRGSFRAASTGLSGGIRSVKTLLNHTIPGNVDSSDPEKILDRIITTAGLENNYFGLLTAVPIHQACVLQFDFITVFITAGIRREPPATGGSINILVVSSQGMEDAALLETVLVATEAKAEALHLMDLPITGTPADAVIAACEGDGRHRSAGRGTEAGRRVRDAVLHGIPEAIRRHDAGIKGDRPAFFIFSRIKGDHWIEWTGEDCPYYPCHFEGQSCDYCYCPFYPCHDEMLGQWVAGSGGGKIWNCTRCRLPHEPAIAAYLHKFPEASREELLLLAAKQKTKQVS